MEYMSVAEASKKWGVSLRRIQKLCVDGRIAGARKYGNAWMLPSAAAKPGDPRRERVCATRFLPNLFLAASVPLCEYSSEAAGKCFAKKGEREQFLAERCYFTGDYENAARYSASARGYDAMGLCANVTLALSALNMGSFELYSDADASLAHIAFSCGGDGAARRLAELARSVIATSLYATERCADWIAGNNFSRLASEPKLAAIFVYAKYLLRVENYERLVGVAETALNTHEGEGNILCVYLELMCALGWLGLGDEGRARSYVDAAVEAALPYGIISPFAEKLPCFGDLIAKSTAGRFDEEYARILSAWETVSANWNAMRAKIAQKNPTLVLTLREYQAALLIRRGLTEDEAADKLGLSASAIRDALACVKGKLNVNGRDELERFFA